MPRKTRVTSEFQFFLSSQQLRIMPYSLVVQKVSSTAPTSRRPVNYLPVFCMYNARVFICASVRPLKIGCFSISCRISLARGGLRQFLEFLQQIQLSLGPFFRGCPHFPVGVAATVWRVLLATTTAIIV